MEKTVDDYMNRPYTIELHQEPEEGWFVRVKELPGCVSEGDTAEEALTMIREAMRLWLEVALAEGIPVPESRSEEDYSGSPQGHRAGSLCRGQGQLGDAQRSPGRVPGRRRRGGRALWPDLAGQARRPPPGQPAQCGHAASRPRGGR